MRPEAKEIEVEVLEIDGVAQTPPQTRPNPSSAPRDWRDWRHWGGQVRQLDSRWWPLWLVLGIIALVLLLTVGLIIGVLVLIFRTLVKIIRAF